MPESQYPCGFQPCLPPQFTHSNPRRPNFLYIQESDQKLLTQYILSLQRLRAAVYPLLIDEPAAWEVAGRPKPARFVDIDAVTQEAADLRSQVLHQMRHALPSLEY
jgi:hypothetical protein